MEDFGIVAVAVLLPRGISQSFLNSKRFPDIFPNLGHGVLVQNGMFSRGGGCSLKYLLVKVFDLPNQLGLWKLLWVAVLLDSGFSMTFTLYFFIGVSFFLFSVALVSFLISGLVTGWVGLDWSDWGWSFGPNFPSSSRYVFIFLIMVGWGQSLVLQGLHLMIWHVLSLLNVWIPCIDVILTSTGR